MSSWAFISKKYCEPGNGIIDLIRKFDYYAEHDISQFL